MTERRDATTRPLHDSSTLLTELRALLKTAQEVAFELGQIGAGEGSRPSSLVAPDGPESSRSVNESA